MTTFIIITFMLLLPFFAAAQQPLTMDEAVQRALAQSPRLQAIIHETRAAAARPGPAASLPDPQVGVEVKEVPLGTFNVEESMTTYMVEQEIPFPTKLIYGYKAERRAAEAARARESAEAQELIRLVKNTYLDLYRIDEERKIEERALLLYRTDQGAAETAYATLRASIADPVRAGIDAGEAEGHLAELEQERVETLAMLSTLMGETLDPDITVASPPSPSSLAPLEELLGRARVHRPDVAEANKMTQSEHARVALTRSHFGPDLSFRWGYMARPNQENAWEGRVMASIPLWSLSKQRLEVQESKAMLQRTKSMRDETLLMTDADVRSSYAHFQAASKLLTLYEHQVMPKAELALTSSREAYKNGHGDFLNVVDSIRSLVEAHHMAIRARTDQAKACADLERAVGASITQEVSS